MAQSRALEAPRPGRNRAQADAVSRGSGHRQGGGTAGGERGAAVTRSHAHAVGDGGSRPLLLSGAARRSPDACRADHGRQSRRADRTVRGIRGGRLVARGDCRRREGRGCAAWTETGAGHDAAACTGRRHAQDARDRRRAGIGGSGCDARAHGGGPRRGVGRAWWHRAVPVKYEFPELASR